MEVRFLNICPKANNQPVVLFLVQINVDLFFSFLNSFTEHEK